MRQIAILDSYFASQLGCAPDDLNSGRITIVPNDRIFPSATLYGKHIPMCLRAIGKGRGAVIAVRSDRKDKIERILQESSSTGLDEDSCSEIQTALAPLVNARDWFRGVRLYCDQETFIDKSFGEVQIVTGEDSIAIDLHNKWGGEVFGQIVDGKVVSWFVFKPRSETVWELAIQTLPEYRGKSYAKSVASIALKSAFERGKIVSWDADHDNTASIRTARALGFQDYSLDFGCVCRSSLITV